MRIICISNIDKFEYGKSYNAHPLPGLGTKKSKGYWVDDRIGNNWIYCRVKHKDFIPIDKYRKQQINKILK